jgi:putative tryptophan/tyrosine transport system substrate-binding protein
MRRREFIWLVGDAAAAWPLPARAQQRKIPIVGFLGATTPSTAPDRTGAFVQRLSELGWNDGSTVKIAYRWAEASEERAAQIAAEFARLNVDVIVTSGVPEIRAAKRVTATIPIVFAVSPPTRLEPGLSQAWPSPAATSPDFPTNQQKFPANDSSCCANLCLHFTVWR